MSEGSSDIVELFIRSIEKKHDLTFDKEKEEYFRVLFDTYLNGQGNPEELREYIAAGIDNVKVIDILAQEVAEWQTKAVGLRAAEAAKNTEEVKAKEAKEQEGKEQEADNKKATEAAEAAAKVKQEDKAVQGEKKVEEHGRKKHKFEPRVKGDGEKGEKGEGLGLKQQLSAQGKQKCRFYPFCKNNQTCQFFHPTQKCNYFPNCRFGQSCLYQHQTCKFKDKCLKPNCPFAHPFKKTNPLEEMMRTIMSQNNPLSRNKKKPYKGGKEHGGESNYKGNKDHGGESKKE